ncbi:hypothetical protein BMS3Abin05_01406 [bacterium BMS3Abin05]|nr:hypothetical protein BMS3Abin05_01406 [bacterium BMS3Abin05]GBE26793.1 hypothetical protein BMS3Bbin03_00712 [bacterium BMS3Bbin03]HDZ11752.1 hypothetical protein [Bacteroidota bacterium]
MGNILFWLFWFFGFFFIVFSFLFLFAPHLVIIISEWGNRLILTDHDAVLHRKWVGIFLGILSVVMFILALSY